MALPLSRRPPSDPMRLHLMEVRRGLLRLHKALIDSERVVFERRSGRMSNGQFLQALLQDPFFAWLRPFSGLITEIDEALASDEPPGPLAAMAYIQQVRALVTPEPGSEPAARYEQVRQRDPDVLGAHVELIRRIAAAGPVAA
ncbi:MAG TPA: hypothetical protein VHG28_03700 [Longimicrobiaceae bacterium]|nr:hypothetical protein [Longimicrobiaceae bacterium]